jgi:hypothetical protein
MSDDIQRRYDAVTRKYDDLNGFAEVLRAHKLAARSTSRGAEHLMWRDMNDLYHFVCANPEALGKVAP